jgi:hypothetical protein
VSSFAPIQLIPDYQSLLKLHFSFSPLIFWGKAHSPEQLKKIQAQSLSAHFAPSQV